MVTSFLFILLFLSNSLSVPPSLPLSLRGLDTLSKKGKTSTLDLPIESVSLSLQDLIGYFQPPDEHLEHEDKQNRLRALKNRQNLFQEEVALSSGVWDLGSTTVVLFFVPVFHFMLGVCCMCAGYVFIHDTDNIQPPRPPFPPAH